MDAAKYLRNHVWRCGSYGGVGSYNTGLYGNTMYEGGHGGLFGGSRVMYNNSFGGPMGGGNGIGPGYLYGGDQDPNNQFDLQKHVSNINNLCRKKKDRCRLPEFRRREEAQVARGAAGRISGGFTGKIAGGIVGGSRSPSSRHEEREVWRQKNTIRGYILEEGKGK
ncbi:hypothetical protein L2E82_38649 [Cichorium intybus]|uniref:Uncharacterized protein n=1 Tax=Cichorium intybus TaxID=13427 RepID=A0ACB9AFR9_CICIN|nr:hypothetical protein L2E82_38649 [Cichorium intybus]